MYHFGYGSNLSIKCVHEELIPTAKYVGKGFLPNFEVSWPFWSEKEQEAYSGILEAPGELVHGALYEVTEEDLVKTDNMVDVYKDLYRRETFLVLNEAGKWVKADLYRVIEPKGPFPPAHSYVTIMLEGARDLGLDPEYIKKIEKFYEESQ